MKNENERIKSPWSDEFLNKNKEPPAPIIEISDEKKPLFIFGVPLSFNLFGRDIDVNFMATAMHLIKKDKIKLIARLRFEETREKEVFEFKDELELKDIEKAKEEIRKMYKNVFSRSKSIITELKKPFEINFEINESFDSIQEKLIKSDEFDITKP